MDRIACYCACRAATHHDHHHLTVNLYAFPFTVVGEDILLHLPTQLFRLLDWFLPS